MSEASPAPQGRVAVALTEAVVAMTRRYTGRGANDARAIIDRDVVVVILRDVLTRGEQVLVDRGREAEVLLIRRTFQEAMRDEISAEIARIVGRPVVAFMSANHVSPDRSAEIFLLGDAIEA